MRALVHKPLQRLVLEELHCNHSGMNQMKRIARSYVWWPNIDQHTEGLVKSCPSCQSNQDVPLPAPLQTWSWTAKPWQHIHGDFAGPFLGKMFLLIADAHSKWPEVYEMPSTTASATVRVLCHLFAAYGLPLQLVLDIGPHSLLKNSQPSLSPTERGMLAQHHITQSLMD